MTEKNTFKTFTDEQKKDQYKDAEDSLENEKSIRPLHVFPEIKHIIRTMIKTRDVFYIGFYADSSEDDICIYEFKKVQHIREELVGKLGLLNLRKDIKRLILENFDYCSDSIEDDIKHYGVPHFWSIKE